MENNPRALPPIQFIHQYAQQSAQQQALQVQPLHPNAQSHLVQSRPIPTASLQDIIVALPHAIDNLYRDFSVRFNRLESHHAREAQLRRAAQPAPQLPPPNPPTPAPDFTHAAFSATFASIESKLSKLESDVADTREENCADMLSVRQGIESVTRAITALGTRLGRMESSLENMGGVVEEARRFTGRVQNVECLLSELLEKANDPDADKPAVVCHEVAVMTEDRPEESLSSLEDLELSPVEPLTPMSTALRTLPTSPIELQPRLNQGTQRMLHNSNAGTETVDYSSRSTIAGNTTRAYIDAGMSTDEPSASSSSPTNSPEILSAMKNLMQMLAPLTSAYHLHGSDDLSALRIRMPSLAPALFRDYHRESRMEVDDCDSPASASRSPNISAHALNTGRSPWVEQENLFREFLTWRHSKDLDMAASPREEQRPEGPSLAPARWSLPSMGSFASTEDEEEEQREDDQPQVKAREEPSEAPTPNGRPRINASGNFQGSLKALGKRKREPMHGDEPELGSLPPQASPAPQKSPMLSSAVPTELSAMSPSRETSPGPTVHDLRQRWVGHRAGEMNASIQSVGAETYESGPGDEAAAPKNFSSQPGADDDSSSPVVLSESEAQAPQPHDPSSPFREPSVPPTGFLQGEYNGESSNAGADLPALDTADDDHYDLSHHSHTPHSLDDHLTRELERELERMDQDLQMQIEAEFLADNESSRAETPSSNAEKDVREIEVETSAPLTESAVRQLEESVGISPHRTISAPHRAPSIAASEWTVSTLTSISSDSEDEEGSSSDSGRTVRAAVEQEEDVEEPEPESEEETTRAVMPSLPRISKRKRKSTAKKAALDKAAQVAALLFPPTPPEGSASASAPASSASSTSTSKSSGAKRKTQISGKSPAKKRRKTGSSAGPHFASDVAQSIWDSSPPSVTSAPHSSRSAARKHPVSSVPLGKAVSKSASKKKKGWTKKKSKSSTSLKALTISVPPIAATQAAPMTYWEVLQGYNGPAKWPEALSEGNRVGDFIQCTACEAWYHFGCLAIEEDDPRTEDDVDLLCPPCEVSFKKYGIGRKLRNIVDQYCARLDCTLHTLTASADSETYFLERIIGRIPRSGGGDGTDTKPGFMWLFKWHNYDAKECTWEDSSKLPSEGVRFIQEFEEEARKQGYDVEDPDKRIVLEEGAKAGWRRAGW